MPTTFDSLDYELYNNGVPGATQIIGRDQNNNRVVRYSFTTPPEGADSIAFAKDYIGVYGESSSTDEQFRFFISTSPDDYANADYTYEFHGTAEMTYVGGYYALIGSASNLRLLPNTQYYLFIFPGYTSDGYWYFNYPGDIGLTLSGSIGLVRIYNGTKFINAIPLIYTGEAWKFTIPLIYNGEAWKISS